MTFYMDNTTDEEKRYYEQLLQVTGSLSKLFSENTKPYLASRLTENLFCRCLRAENLSRRDITADAKKNGIGIGIKTWIENSSQKIAEFNAERPNYENLNAEEKIKYISQLRNERISFTLRTQGLSKMIYHCTLRDDGMIKVSRVLKETAAKALRIKEQMEKKQGISPTMEDIAKETGVSTEDLVLAMEAVSDVESLSQTVYSGDGMPILLGDKLPDRQDRNEELLNRILLRQLMDFLSGEEKEVIRLRYFEEQTQMQVAMRLGMTQVQVSRAEKKILKKLREAEAGKI